MSKYSCWVYFSLSTVMSWIHGSPLALANWLLGTCSCLLWSQAMEPSNGAKCSTQFRWRMRHALDLHQGVAQVACALWQLAFAHPLETPFTNSEQGMPQGSLSCLPLFSFSNSSSYNSHSESLEAYWPQWATSIISLIYLSAKSFHLEQYPGLHGSWSW